MAAARRSVPDRLVEYDGGAERIGQTGHGIGQIDAAEPLVGEAVAVCVDHDASGRDLVDIGPRPQPDSVHRVAAVQMAVEHAEGGARSADCLCHAQAIAGRGSTVAREKLLGRGANVSSDHVEVGLEAAVGDDNGWCFEFGGAFGLARLNLDSARSKLQRPGTHPAQNPTLPLPQVFFEPRQRNVASISSPGKAKPFSPCGASTLVWYPP